MKREVPVEDVLASYVAGTGFHAELELTLMNDESVDYDEVDSGDLFKSGTMMKMNEDGVRSAMEDEFREFVDRMVE